MKKSNNEMAMEGFILQFRDKDGKYLLENPPFEQEKNQKIFKSRISKMIPGEIKVFEQIELKSLPMSPKTWVINTSAHFANFVIERGLSSYQRRAIYPLVKNFQRASSLRYDFLVCYKRSDGILEMTPIEVNGPQHYDGDGPALAKQITYDIAKYVASRQLGLEILEIDASRGIDYCGYSLVEKVLQKYGATKV